jgi:preprotein translocase subunit Sec63
MTYGPRMVFDAFFNAPDLPEEKTGGWLVRGHDKDDVYQEFIVIGKWSNNYCPKGWIDWIRVPIEVGSALLKIIV